MLTRELDNKIHTDTQTRSQMAPAASSANNRSGICCCCCFLFSRLILSKRLNCVFLDNLSVFLRESMNWFAIFVGNLNCKQISKRVKIFKYPIILFNAHTRSPYTVFICPRFKALRKKNTHGARAICFYMHISHVSYHENINETLSFTTF